jgi:hypothetical protein
MASGSAPPKVNEEGDSIFSVEQTRIQKFIRSDPFDQFFGVVLILNAVIMGIQVDWNARNLHHATPPIYAWLDRIFCLLFLSELVARIYVDRLRFYWMPGCGWSWFDTLIVGLQVVDELLRVMMSMIASGSDSGKAGFELDVGFLKLLKICLLLRMVRMVRLIPELKSMVYLILASMSSFFWTCILLLLLIYMIAVYMTMMARDVMEADPALGDPENRDTILRQWGSIGDSIVSLFHSISGGADWADLIGPLVTETGNKMHNVLFIMYIAFSTMVIMNLVTGVFVEGAQRLNKMDKDKELTRLAYKTFNVVDDDGSAEISWEELQSSMDNGMLVDYLIAMDLSQANAADLFEILDADGSGSLSVGEFVEGCMRLKGQARAADVCQLLCNTKRLQENVNAILLELRECSPRINRIEHQMHIVNTKMMKVDAMALADRQGMVPMPPQYRAVPDLVV